MGETTGIGWTDHTASPWWGCLKVSPGCEHCFAETLAVTRRKLPVWGPSSTTERKRIASAIPNMVKWNKAAKRDGVRRKMFVASMCDVFESHPQVAPWRAEALDVIAQCDGLDVQLLTKRPENIRAMVPPAWLESWPAHVWVGTTVEDQRRANERIPHLLNVPARVRFLSMEPLLESVDLTAAVAELFCMKCRAPVTISESGDPDDTSEGERSRWVDPECPHACPDCGGETDGRYPNERISWAIVGGESGPGARPFDIAWARSIVKQCDDAGVPVFVKQCGDNPVIDGARVKFKAHHAADPSEWPADLQRQEFPNGGAK